MIASLASCLPPFRNRAGHGNPSGYRRTSLKTTVQTKGEREEREGEREERERGERDRDRERE